MGEAIAAFRKYALRARESLDEWRFTPAVDDDPQGPDPDDPSDLFLWHQEANYIIFAMAERRIPAREYVEKLHALRRESERDCPKPSNPTPKPFRPVVWFEGPPKEKFYSDRERGRAVLRALADDAVREAIQWGPLAERVEDYVRQLFNTTEKMVHAVAESLEPMRRVDHRDYTTLVERWFDAFDGLSPFEGSLTDEVSTAASEAAEEEFPSRSAGRPRTNDESLERELVTGWFTYCEHCKKAGGPPATKSQYIAERNRDALKDATRLAALNAKHRTLLESGLRSKRRKKAGLPRTNRR